MKHVLKALVQCLFLSALSLSAHSQFTDTKQEYVDDNTLATAGKIMHVCPSGYMSGFHEKKNDLLCFRQGAPSYVNSGFVDDYNTLRFGMHACPLGMAMVGIHVKDNVLKCAQLHNSLVVQYSEYLNYDGGPNLRYNMHACPEGWVMTGIHVKKNIFLCSQLNIQYNF